MVDVITNEADRSVAQLVTITVNNLVSAMNGGKNAAVSVAAMIVADQNMGGTPMSRRKLLALIARRMDDKGEKKSSFATYNRIGQQLVTMYGAEIGSAIAEATAENARLSNKPVTGRILFEAVYTALARIPSLMGSYSELRAATIGGVPVSKDDKASAKVRNLVNAINKLDAFEIVAYVAKVAANRAALLNPATPRDDINKIDAEAKLLIAEIMNRYAPAAGAEDAMMQDDDGELAEQAAA